MHIHLYFFSSSVSMFCVYGSIIHALYIYSTNHLCFNLNDATVCAFENQSKSPAMVQMCKVHWSLFLWKTDNNSKQTNKQTNNNKTKTTTKNINTFIDSGNTSATVISKPECTANNFTTECTCSFLHPTLFVGSG